MYWRPLCFAKDERAWGRGLQRNGSACELNGVGIQRKNGRNNNSPAQEVRNLDLVRLDDAWSELARIDEQQMRLVELRFFGGLTVEEAAEVLPISRSTAKRDWNVAKAWLSRQLKRGTHGEERKLAKD